MTNMVVVSLLSLFIEAEQEILQESLNRQKSPPSKQTQRRKPMCHTCGKPRKSHKKGSCD